MKKLELGKYQKEWIATLREHPERQCKEQLGKVVDGQKTMCCLCQLAETAPFEDVEWVEGVAFVDRSICILKNWKRYGLLTSDGKLKERVNINGNRYWSLSDMNDSGLKWPEIADYVEANPENVFTKSY